MPEVYWVYSGFDSAPGNDSKLQQRRILFQDPRKEKYLSACGYQVYSDFGKASGNVLSSRKGDIYS